MGPFLASWEGFDILDFRLVVFVCLLVFCSYLFVLFLLRECNKWCQVLFVQGLKKYDKCFSFGREDG